jgi:pimeloyl-ACP methyl ester carboxylesterase
MTTEAVKVNGNSIEVLRIGQGKPVLYLHGVWDVHTLQAAPFPFHTRLAEAFEVIIPAHPGCGASEGIKQVNEISDLTFHYLDMLDALGLESALVVGYCLGGWIGAEMAVTNPERVSRLAMIGSAGLQRQDALIGDLFMYSQHRDGGIMHELRELLFSDPDGGLANEIVPDGRVSVENEVRRYKSLTLTGRVGWEPPYLHNKKLKGRLHRLKCPTLLMWGEDDRLVPIANGRTWAESVAQSRLVQFAGAGHSLHIEEPDGVLAELVPFLKGER